jgi:hypothetical protein
MATLPLTRALTKPGRLLPAVLTYLLLCGLAFFMLAPFAYMVTTAF